MLGVIGISFLVVMSFEAQANTLESMSADITEEVYHHDLKVSGSLMYNSIGDDFGVIDEGSYSDLDGCSPSDLGLYGEVGGSVNVEPFFDGDSESCGDLDNFLVVTAVKTESGNEDFARLEVGE